MAKKISITITPKYKFNLMIPDKQSFKDPAQIGINLLDFIGRNFSLSVALLIFLLPSFTDQYSFSVFSILIYAVAIIFVATQILRVLTVKGPHFLSIPLDIPLLILTTIISLSFFFNTAIVRTNTNIWGGQSLNAISGESIISLALIYYFFYINNQSKSSLRHIISAFKVSPLLSFSFVILLNLQISSSVIDFISILFPAQFIWWLYVHFSGKTKAKIDILNIVNLLISIFCLLYFYNPINILVVTITLFIVFLTLVITKRNELGKMFNNIDKKYLSFYDRIAKNKNLSILISTFVLMSLGIYSLLKIPNFNDYYFIYNGFVSLSELEGASLLFGRGLVNTVSVPLLFQFINAYGILPFLSLTIVGVFFTKRAFTILSNLLNTQARTVFKSLVITIISIILFVIFSSSTSLFPLVILSASTSMILLLEKIFSKANNEFNFSKVPIDFKSQSEENAFFLKAMRGILIALIIIFTIYLLCSLNYINIFINA